MLEAIAVNYGFNPEGGTKNYSFSTYDSHSELCDAIRLSRGFNKPGWGYFLRAESFYNVASAEDEYSKWGGVPQHFHERSHGESFLQLVQSNFKGHGLYLLDEPEAEILSFDDGQVHPISYEDTDSYQVTKMFIENRKQLLNKLLSD